jgi:hypothetical protein
VTIAVEVDGANRDGVRVVKMGETQVSIGC